MIKAIMATMVTREFAKIFAVAGGMVAMAAVLQALVDPTFGFVRHLPFYVFVLLVLMMGSAMLAHAMNQCTKVETEIEFERRFREILEETRMLAAGLETNGKITFCNDALLRATGWQRDEVINQDWFSTFVPKEICQQTKEAFHRLATGREAEARHETEILTQAGEKWLASWSACQIKDTMGRVIGIACIGEDITDARAADIQLRKLSYAVEQSPSVIMIVDTKGNIEYVNPKFTELTGYSLAEVKGENPRVLKSGETSTEEYEDLWETVSRGGEWQGLFHNRKKNGDLYWEEARISAIRGADGNVTHFLAVKEDVTDRIRLEQEVAERNKEIARTNALAVTGRMANMIAHDLRNPLSTIKMGLQLLAREVQPGTEVEQKELRELSLEQVQYMEDILADLLAFSRPDALQLEWLDLAKLLDTTILTSLKYVQDFEAEVTQEYEHGLPTLHGDARKLRRVFSNLVVNAVQAMESLPPSERRVEVAAELDVAEGHPGMRIEIRDRGPGIEEDMKNTVMEPFYTSRSTGTGLGLPIVQSIIDQHGGAFELVARDDGGTCAVVTLPLGPVDQLAQRSKLADGYAAEAQS